MRRGRAGSSGGRSGLWSENKFSNLTPYEPFDSQIDKLANMHWEQLQNTKELLFFEYDVAPGFIQPLSLNIIRKFVGQVPQVFLTDLRGIFLCPGSKKQLKFSSGSYGCYVRSCKSIFLFPFPDSLSFYFKTKPKPSLCLEYERHGATWKQQGRAWKLEFTLESLRSFYLRDVLVHEVGHHVDYTASIKGINYNERERFAEWFAYEFGMRKSDKELSEFGQMIQQIINAKGKEDKRK